MTAREYELNGRTVRVEAADVDDLTAIERACMAQVRPPAKVIKPERHDVDCVCAPCVVAYGAVGELDTRPLGSTS